MRDDLDGIGSFSSWSCLYLWLMFLPSHFIHLGHWLWSVHVRYVEYICMHVINSLGHVHFIMYGFWVMLMLLNSCMGYLRREGIQIGESSHWSNEKPQRIISTLWKHSYVTMAPIFVIVDASPTRIGWFINQESEDGGQYVVCGAKAWKT